MILVQLACDGCHKVFAAARPGGTIDHARWGKYRRKGPCRDYCPECFANITPQGRSSTRSG